MKTLGFGLYPLVANLVHSRLTRWPAGQNLATAGGFSLHAGRAG